MTEIPDVVAGEVLTGPAGTATEMIISGERRPSDATVAAWWLNCPGQSPAWQDYMLAVIHLRPIAGELPIIITPHATHEVMLVALDPGRFPVLEDPRTWSFLRPHNLVEQIELPDDEAAATLLREAAAAVVDGILWAEPPLSGQREPWRTSLLKTAAHHRGEVHAP